MKTILLIAVALSFLTQAHAEIRTGKVTLDFSASDPDMSMAWKGLDLDSGLVTEAPRFAAPGWTVRLKQGYVSTNGAKAALVKTGDFSSITEASTKDSDYVADERYDPSGPAPEDVYNRTLMGWYDYFFFEGHLLAPYAHVYVLKTGDGHYAKLEIADYVKNGRAIRLVKEKDFLGRERMKKRGVVVMKDDGMVHVTVHYKYNTVSGDPHLE